MFIYKISFDSNIIVYNYNAESTMIHFYHLGNFHGVSKIIPSQKHLDPLFFLYKIRERDTNFLK